MAETTQPTPNQKLRRERERRGWSQQDVADKVGTTPLNVSRWERGINFPNPYFRQKLSEVFEKSLPELGLSSDNISVDRPVEPTPVSSSPSSPSAEVPTSFWNVPYNRNPLFTGREGILTQLHMALNAQESPVALTQPQAISGLGGIGKTQTAIEYAYRYREEYDAVFWARADSRDLLISDFLLIASLLNLPQRNEQDQSKVVSAVLRWFDSHERWLLILDNADQLQVASEFIPSGGKGHVLLTTRAHSTGTVAQRIELEKMEVEEAILLLLRRAKQVKGNTLPGSVPEVLHAQARAIVEAVDGLPLAIDQAGAYIEETGCSMADYLKFYRTRRHRLLRARGKDSVGHPEPVATTWSLSFEKVEQANPAAAELLRLCAFLHPDEIPESMIMEGASELGSVLRPVAEDEFDLNEAIAELRRYSLVKRDPERKILNMHRLVQAVIRDGMDKETELQWAERVVRMVSRVFPEVEFANWKKCLEYLPQVQICATLSKEWNIVSLEAAFLFNQVGNYLRERSQYREAEPFLQYALVIRQQLLAPGHPDIAESMNNLGVLYFDQAKYSQVELLYGQALEIWEKQAGKEHPDTAVALANLASIYKTFVQDEQAEFLYLQALAIRERTHGVSHPWTAHTYNELAEFYRAQGKYAQAEPLYRKALSIREQCLGSDHPETAYSLDCLGLLYRDQGKYTESEQFLKRALAIREKQLGYEHHQTSQSLNNLARLYVDQGKYTQAEPLYIKALEFCERQLTPDHRTTARNLHELANLYSIQGRYEKAESLFLRALKIREKILGLEHPETASSLNDLAALYSKQGKYSQAEPLYQRAIAIREQQLGYRHSRTADSLSDLAVLYTNQEKYDHAESLFQRALSIYEESLGYEHPNIAKSLQNYATLLRKTDRESEAAALEQRAQAIRARQEE